MSSLLSVYWILIAALWYFVNGILHDIFIVKEHKGPYNRELLRLLMDGHVLILSGALMFVCYLMMQNKITYGAVMTSIVAAGMIVYCLMIFPFLKSFVTLFISIVVLMVAMRFMFLHKGI